MPICLICTVGQTVIANSDAAARDFLRDFGQQKGLDLRAIAEKKQGFPGQQWYSLVMASLQAKSSDSAMLRRASAELNHLVPTLAAEAPHRSDRLYFLASETPDGVLAARILADFCKVHFERETVVEIVEGLQVDDGDRFRRLGLNSLISKVFTFLRDAPEGTYRRIINPTGGFKGVVPYLTLIGMLQQVEISYIYEHSKDVIRLAGVPLRLDFEMMESAYDALLKCNDPATPLSEPELRQYLGTQDQPIASHPLWSLFDFIDVGGETYYEPSGLGRIVIEHFKSKRRIPVYMSRQAAQRFDGLDNNQRTNYIKILDNIHDSVWREQGHRHEYKGCAEPAIKLAREDERAFYHDFGDYILVLELAVHRPDGSYDRVPGRLKDYDRMRLWEGSKR